MPSGVILSICIPVYNRVNVFSAALFMAAKAANRHINEVEIVISDNASEDDIHSVVEDIIKIFPRVNISYNRNLENLGLAGNFLRLIEMSHGKYCWIVGSDDFVLDSGLDAILRIVTDYPDIDFLCVEYAGVDLLEKDSFVSFSDYIDNVIKHPETWTRRRIQKKSGEKVWDELVDPAYKNVFLGAMMCGIFRRLLWNSVDKSVIKPSTEFTSIENTYPHCYIYSRCMPGRKAWYYNEPCILTGSGQRDWAGEDNGSFWLSSMPIIFLKILTEIVESYEIGGLDKHQLKKVRRWVSSNTGGYLSRYLMRRYILGKRVKGSELINSEQIFRKYRSSIFFYLGPLILVAKDVRRLLLRIRKKMFQSF